MNETIENDLRPKPIPARAQEGVDTFTVHRESDETGVSGAGIVAQGCVFGSGYCVINWLTPRPRGNIVIWESLEQFLSIHATPHPGNRTRITFSDGTQKCYPPEPASD